jgi:hypothetical protein
MYILRVRFEVKEPAMVAGLTLVLLLTAGTQSTDDVPVLGPTRRIDAMVQPSRKAVGTETPARCVSHVPRIVLTVGGYAGEGAPYQSYPLPSPSGFARGAEGELAINFSRAYLTADVQKRFGGRGWSADVSARIHVASLKGFSMSVMGLSVTGMSGDLIYRGPADVGLGMRQVSSMFMFGTALRRGDVDEPVIELVTLGGAARAQQIPELWLSGAPFAAHDPLTQISRNPVYLVGLRSSLNIWGRFVVTGSAEYIGWVGDTAMLLPDHAIVVQSVVRYGIWRSCSVSLKGRWSDDNRGPALNRTSLSVGITVQKR